MPVELAVEVGRTKMTIREALALGPGSIVTLNRLAGEPVDLLVNGKPIARGEVVVIDEEFGLRVTEVLAPGRRAPRLTPRQHASGAVYGRCASRRPSRRRLLAQGLRGQPHGPGVDGRLQPAGVDLPAGADRAVRGRARAALARSSPRPCSHDAQTIFPTRGREHAARRCIRRLEQASTTVGIVAIVSSLWVGASFWGALDTAFCRIYHLPCRTWVRQKLFGLGMLVVVLLFIAASVAVPTAQSLLAHGRARPAVRARPRARPRLLG